MRNMIAGLALTASLLVAGTACDMPTPCEGLTVSQQDVEAAGNGYEVEREDSMGNTCELSRDGQSWHVDD